ncbi:hypothetical protein DFJ77DRAFT_509346 [Powellomyces hirtus]|nr:hypothetical protein DFJ77DRAFT_509346 [Powellomyces hirtus]
MRPIYGASNASTKASGGVIAPAIPPKPIRPASQPSVNSVPPTPPTPPARPSIVETIPPPTPKRPPPPPASSVEHVPPGKPSPPLPSRPAFQNVPPIPARPASQSVPPTPFRPQLPARPPSFASNPQPPSMPPRPGMPPRPQSTVTSRDANPFFRENREEEVKSVNRMSTSSNPFVAADREGQRKGPEDHMKPVSKMSAANPFLTADRENQAKSETRDVTQPSRVSPAAGLTSSTPTVSPQLPPRKPLTHVPRKLSQNTVVPPRPPRRPSVDQNSGMGCYPSTKKEEHVSQHGEIVLQARESATPHQETVTSKHPCPSYGRVPGSDAEKYVYMDFSAVDNYAKETPVSHTINSTTLSSYLTGPFRHSEVLQLRSIFAWITHNIAYDTEKFFRGQLKHQSAEETLINRKGVCSAYAELFAALCQHAGLATCRSELGASKGYGYRPGSRPSANKDAHAWNVVFVDGGWRMIDACWGAGPINAATNQFEYEFNPFWFLTHPDEFVFSHLPKNESAQYTTTLVTDHDFDNRPNLRADFWNSNAFLTSHTDTGGSIVPPSDWNPGTDDICVRFIVPTNYGMTTSLKDEMGQAIEDAIMVVKDFMPPSSSETSIPGALECVVRVRPPRTGTFDLSIFGKHNSDTTKSEFGSLVSFSLQVPTTTIFSKPTVLFPKHYSSTLAKVNVSLISPLVATLPLHGHAVFAVRHLAGSHILTPGCVELFSETKRRTIPMSTSPSGDPAVTLLDCKLDTPGSWSLVWKQNPNQNSFDILVTWEVV